MKILNRIKEFIIDWVWQLPQNICGLVYKACIKDKITKHFDSEPSHCDIYMKKSNGGVALGRYIFIYKGYNDLLRVVRHEQGHVVQSRILGPLYLLVIGLPSIIWAATHKWLAPSKDYYWFYTEAWANKLGGL